MFVCASAFACVPVHIFCLGFFLCVGEHQRQNSFEPAKRARRNHMRTGVRRRRGFFFGGGIVCSREAGASVGGGE